MYPVAANIMNASDPITVDKAKSDWEDILQKKFHIKKRIECNSGNMRGFTESAAHVNVLKIKLFMYWECMI